MASFVDALLRRMTLEEKVGQLTQWSGRGSDEGPRIPEGEFVARARPPLAPPSLPRGTAAGFFSRSGFSGGASPIASR